MTDMIERVFNSILTMSLTGAAAAAVVILVRLALRRAPKAVSYGLWFVVLFRLVCPVSFQSALSLFGPAASLLSAQTPVLYEPSVPDASAAVTANPAGFEPAVVSPSTVSPAAEPMTGAWPVMSILALVWAAGVLALLVYGVVSYLKTMRGVRTATLVSGNIYESGTITSPFVAGFIRPRVYLPVSLGEQERAYILLHEQTHIRRRDYLIKPLWFLTLCLHWFNPVVWVSYLLLGRDIEMSCDEAVIGKMGDSVRADYSASLLALAAPRALAASPLAFGESNTFSRVKNVLNFKKPVFKVVILAVLVATATFIALASNPADKPEPGQAENYLQYKTAYIGDNSKVGGIISLMAFPEDIAYDHFELETSVQPYGVTIYLNADEQSQAFYSQSVNRTLFYVHAAILFALVDNADTVGFVLDADNADALTFSFSRADIDSVYGTDVRTYAESADTFTRLLNGPPKDAQSEPGTTSAAPLNEPSYTLARLQNGSVTFSFEAGINGHAQAIILDYMIRSVAWEAVDISRLDVCYKLDQTYPDGTQQTFYAFMLDGYACVQMGETGRYSNVSLELYDALKQFVDKRVTGAVVEENLAIIESSPLVSSRPGDYIDAHRAEYEAILKLGQPAVDYMLSLFAAGEGDTLKAHIMRALCQDILGPGYAFPDEYLTPTQWYERIITFQEVALPDYEYTGDDPVLKLVYETETAVYHELAWDGGFTVVAPHVFGSYEEDGYLKVFVTTYGASYHLYGRTVNLYTGSVVPAAITYRINDDGTYTLDTYEQAKDGAYLASSIREYCTMPVSGDTIEGLADEILQRYGANDLFELQRSNLKELLEANGITDAVLPE